MRTNAEPISTTCACSAIRRTNRAVTQLYDIALATTGITATQFMMLQIIGDEGEIAQCEFARQYSISVETLSRRFSWLRRRGLVTVRIGNHSQRIYSLTESGRVALENARPFWQNAENRLRGELSEPEWQDFLALCEKSVQAAHAAEQLRTRNGHTVPSDQLLDPTECDRAA